MEHKSTFKKSIAWAILLSMFNPALVLPAHALDTDIYTSIQTSANVAQANILIIVDTGDPMNVPEPWREYDPNVYDSHTEYLWNDPTFQAAVTLDLSVPFVWPTTEYGTWGGQGFPTSSLLPADRTTLKNNVIAYTAATQSGDPAARSYWRNYGGGRSARNDGYQDARLLYWVPAGTAETDLRLTAPSWNKWYGNIARVATTTPRGGITWTTTSSLDNSYTAAVNGQTAYNQCKDSQTSATVDAAMTTAANTLANPLPTVPLSIPQGLVPSTAYAPTSAVRNSGRYLNQQWMRWERFLNLTNGRLVAGDSTYPTALGAANGNTVIQAGSAIATTGFTVNARVDFLGNPGGGTPFPVRDSYNSTGTSFGNGATPGVWGQPIRTNVGSTYAGWTTLKADFGGFNYWGALTNAAYYVSTANIQTMLGVYQSTYYGVAPTAANAQWLAFKGNRDQTGPAPTYDITNGTPSYYDSNALDFKVGVVAGLVTICTRTCNISPASGTAVTAPTTDANNGGHTQWWASSATCTSGTVTGTNCTAAPGACGVPAAGVGQYYTTVPNGCAWVGRQSVYVQGTGTWSYGGTCQGSCNGPGHIAGAAPCPATEPNTTNCTVSGVSTPTINGNVLPNAILNAAAPNTTGCGTNGATSQTCAQREGSPGCLYSASCASQIVQSGGGVTPSDYFVYTTTATDTFNYHDCRADDPDKLNLNPNSGYMTNVTNRTFTTSWNTTSSAAGVVAAYTPTAANKITTAPAIDMYSVNYLNWKWGPKSNGNPVGRKTRLQIAKDALVTLVNTTNGVRFGLMNYNLTSNDGSDTNTGAHVTFSVTPMGTTDTSDPSYGTGANTTDITTNRNNLIASINGMVAGSRSPVTEALYEAYLYFRGEAPFGGLLTNCGAPTVSVGGVNIGTGVTCGGATGSVTAGASINSGYAINRGNDNAGASSGNPAVCTAALITSGVCAAGSLGTKYASPMMSNPNPPNVSLGPAACQKNFVIAVTEGQIEDDGAANALIQALQFTDPQGNTWSPDTVVDTTQPDTASHQFETTGQTVGTYCASAGTSPYCNQDQAGSYQRSADNGYVWLDELAWYMSKGDMNLNTTYLSGSQPVITFTIAFGGQTSSVIQNAAVVAGGQYYIASNSAGLATALQQALAAIVAWNPTASSPTVPISALNRTQSSTNVYLAFFGPGGLIDWPGTVKWLELDTTAGDCINDQGITPAVCLVGQTTLNGLSKNIEKTITDASTGAQTIVVNPQAVTFWTPLSGTIPAPVGGTYPLHDGGSANIGGTGHELITNGTPAQRNMYTHLSTSAHANLNHAGNRMRDLNAATITPTVLGNPALTTAQQFTLINWMRGGDVVADPNCSDASDDSTTACATFRSWAHAAVLHSRPTVVTYNSTVNPATQTLFYVSIDGVLHAVDAITGHEQWSFVIEEALPLINTMMTNNAGPQFSIADGSPVVWINNVSQNGTLVAGTDKAYLYFGLRRGGQAYYALDVTDPVNPQMLWKITPSQICSGTGCTADPSYAQMGQTWSTPAVVKLAALGANPGYPALIFGGGYDPNEDTANPGAGTDTMGQALYVVNGSNGALIKAFTNGNTTGGMSYAIPSDPAALNMDNNAQGYTNRVYIGDMGSNLYRFDVADASPTNWGGRIIATLNGGTLRKIFFPPVVVREGPAEAFGQRFDAVYVGTGDKEHPLITTNVDKMFMIKDYFTGFTSTQSSAILPGNLLNITNILSISLADFQAKGDVPAFLAASGWVFDLPNSGEKVSASPEVINNVLNFGTYSPTQSLNACLPPGLGTLYGINAVTGGLADTLLTGSVSLADPRTYASVGIKGRGFVVPGGIIVLGGQVFRVTVVDGALRTIPAGSLYQTRSYWQKEPTL